ncbi:hypothetical protein Tcan_08040 [Toxocara canis]|uniref:Uncharacterized protein n=1 Tax=Toxocara canis TaxID=6265 RepID=A0A0B2USP5_TOXCA|nr:hypothetical protein Tcan_08040 [Toxocara canis]
MGNKAQDQRSSSLVRMLVTGRGSHESLYMRRRCTINVACETSDSLGNKDRGKLSSYNRMDDLPPVLSNQVQPELAAGSQGSQEAKRCCPLVLGNFAGSSLPFVEAKKFPRELLCKHE